MTEPYLRFVVKGASPEIVEDGLELLKLNYRTKDCNQSRVQENRYGDKGYHAFFEVYKEQGNPKIVEFMLRSPKK